MKQFISALGVFLLASVVHSSGRISLPTYSSDLISLIETQERPIPIPFDANPFPWSFVEGTWFAQSGEFRSYYVLRIVRRNGNLRHLEIKQIDTKTCNVVASGRGVEIRNEKKAVAQMSYPATGEIYMMTVRSYDHSKMPGDLDIKPIHGQMVVLTIKPFDMIETYNVPLKKITGAVQFKCTPKAQSIKSF